MCPREEFLLTSLIGLHKLKDIDSKVLLLLISIPSGASLIHDGLLQYLLCYRNISLLLI